MSYLNAINFVWVKTPSFHKDKYEVNDDGFVTFTNFIPPEIFKLARPFWKGNVNHLDKKQSIYSPDLIAELLEQTFIIDIEGVILSQSIKNIPGTLSIHKIINLSDKSHNKYIAKAAIKQRQCLIYNQIKVELWNLFEPGELIDVNEYIQENSLNPSINPFKTGEWTTVTPLKNGKEFDFNLTDGLLHYHSSKFIKKEHGIEEIIIHRIAKIKDTKNLLNLVKLVTDLKKYGTIIAELNKHDFEPAWKHGYSL